MATINGVEVIGDKTAHDFDLLDKDDGINLANGVERNRKATEDNHEDIVLHRTDRDVHVTPAWKNSLVTKEILGLYWTAAQTADIINEISIAGGAKLVKVDALPETGKEQTIYLVPKTDPQERDIFDEFVWIDGKYEFIGTTKVDLSNYATKAELNAKQDALSAQQLSNIADVVNKANASDLTAHTNNADIHVTTSDKANWNAKQDALSNQQLSNIDDVPNKANNADVVHKTGDETISGTKTFNDLQVISYGTQYKGNRDAYILPEFASGYSGLSITTSSFSQTLKIGNFVLNDNNKPVLDTSKAYVQVAAGENNSVNTCLIEPRNSTSSQLGTSSNKWKTINGINPGALSLPSVSSGINLDLTNFKTDGSDNRFRLTNFSNYPYDNWWLFIRLNGCTMYYLDHWYKVVSNEYATPSTAIFFMPINDIDHDITLRCVCTSINHIRLFPCQGNV